MKLAVYLPFFGTSSVGACLNDTGSMKLAGTSPPCTAITSITNTASVKDRTRIVPVDDFAKGSFFCRGRPGRCPYRRLSLDFDWLRQTLSFTTPFVSGLRL